MSSTASVALAVFVLLAAASVSGRIQKLDDVKGEVKQLMNEMPHWP